MTTFNKDFLKNYRFSDSPNAWILEAQAFHSSATLLLQSQQSNKKTPGFISSLEINSNENSKKIACYLYSIAIELFLKALYSTNKTATDKENPDSFGHNVTRLNEKLIAKKILCKNELDNKILELIEIILKWFGRYHKPNNKDIQDIINKQFEEIPEKPGMVRAKFSITPNAIAKLAQTSLLLSNKIPINPASIDSIIFTPF